MKTSLGSGKFFQKGSLMVEVLIMASIITISVLAALAVAQKSIVLVRQSLHQSQAAFLLEEGAEVVRITRDNGWSGISSLLKTETYYISFSGGAWTYSFTPSKVGIFTRRVNFSSAFRDGNQDLAPSGTIDDQTRLVTITVSWEDDGQTFTKTLQFYIADIFS